MTYQPVTHVLFDMDGLILNSEDLYTEAFQNILSRFGKTYAFELKMKLMGLQAHETAEMIVNELQLPLTVDQFEEECKQQFEKLFPECHILPGIQKLIEHLVHHNIPICLATSSKEESYHLKTDKHHQKLFQLFPYKIFGSSDPDVKRGKPHPDIFLVAASRFPEKPLPQQCLVLEDAVNGVKAARTAGMQVVMVPDPRIPKELTAEATLVLKTMEDFMPEMFGLPSFKN